MKRKTRGKYIVLEGPDGTGKGTQIERLKLRLEAAGKEVVMVREPGGTPMGEAVRGLLKDAKLDRTPEAEVFLFSAARAELALRVIEPALKRGAWVISDRSHLSTIAYQIFGHKRHDLAKMVKEITAHALGSTLPDAAIILDIDPKISLARSKKRNAGESDRFDDMQEAFHKRVRKGYLDHAKAAKLPVVDAGRTIEEVEESIWQKIQHLFRK